MIDTVRYIVKDIKPYQIKWFNKFKKCGEGVYEFDFRNTHYVYYIFTKTLLIFTNVHTTIYKRDIQFSDYTQYRKYTRNKVSMVLGNNREGCKYKYNLETNRIDYYTDIKYEKKEELEEMCKLLQKYPKTFKYMKATKDYKTSIHLHNKRGQRNINIYNKEVQSIFNQKYKNTLRVEVQCKKALIMKELKKFGVSRDLKNYWNKQMFQELYLDFLKEFLYKGDYYQLEVAQKKVEEAPYSKTLRNNLCSFLQEINQKGMEDTKKLHSYTTIKKWITSLEDIGVNPITMSNNSKCKKIHCLLDLIEEQVEKVYFK